MFFGIGCSIGGGISGFLASIVNGLLSWLPRTPVSVGVILLASILLVSEASSVRVRLPQAARQLSELIFLNDWRISALRFGVEYGTGCRTYITSNAPYILLLGLVVMPVTVSYSVAIGMAFGFGRSISLLQYIMRRKSNWQKAVIAQSHILGKFGSLAVYLGVSVSLI